MGDRSVLYVVPLYAEGIREHFGVEDYSLAGESKRRDVIASLQRAGYDVTVLAPVFVNDGLARYRRGTVVEDEGLGVEVHAPPAIAGGVLEYILLTLTATVLAFRLLAGRRFDAVLAFNYQLPRVLPAALARIVFGVPFVLEYEDGLFVDPMTSPAIRGLARILRVATAPILDGAVAVNGRLAATAPTDNAAVFSGYPAVDPDVDATTDRSSPTDLASTADPPPTSDTGSNPASTSTSDRAATSDTSSNPDPSSGPERPPGIDDAAGPRRVMFAGRFDRHRGVDEFVDLAPEVLERTAGDVEFWVAGYGSDADRERVASRIEALDSPSVTYLGTLPEESYRDRLRAADVLVSLHDDDHPLSEYTFPTKLLDFLAAGALVVSNPVEDPERPPPEAVVYTDGSRRSVVEALVECLDEYDAFADRRERGRAWVAEESDPGRVADRLDDVIRRANRSR